MRRILAGIGVTLAMAVAGSAPAAAQAGPLKVCFMYVGPHNDGGYSEAHDRGRLYLQETLGDKVETSFLENVPEGPDAERALERLARDGCGLIFSTSFGFMEPTIRVAEQFPDVKFEHATGFMSAPNVATYNARFYEGRYIIGQIAARISETGVAGYIASFPIPEVVMGINAFILGAQSINPDFQVKIIWVNTWLDAAKEADAAKALFDQGADILTQHTDTPAGLRIAEERGLHGFGQSNDMIAFAPEAQLTAIIDEWGPYYVSRAQAVLDGTWETHQIWYGIPEGMVLMAPYTNMPEDVAMMAAETEEEIRIGALHPFAGPIAKQDGSEFVPAGTTIDDGTLLGMNWYVKGITDALPQ